MTIDGNAPGQSITLDGTNVSDGDNCFTIKSANVVIKNLEIQKFANDGITIITGGTTSGGDQVLGCTITGNDGYGIDINNTSNNIIGSANGSGANSITFNKAGGVVIKGTSSQYNVVQNGSIEYNTNNGVLIADATMNVIGVGTQGPMDVATGTAGNVIAGNTGNGVLIQGSKLDGGGTTGNSNSVGGNFIGIVPDVPGGGGLAAGNAGDGISITSSNNVIGGPVDGSPNLISANGGNGISIDSTGSGNLVDDNVIGLNVTGDHYLDDDLEFTGNLKDGITVAGDSNKIGRVEGNTISGNYGYGISLLGGKSNIVEENTLGASGNGNTPLTNDKDAIFVNGTDKNLGFGAPTKIKNNTGFYAPGGAVDGIKIINANPMPTEQGNAIKKDPNAPAGAVFGSALYIENSGDGTVGGTNPGDGNVFDMGVVIVNSSDILFQGNNVGTTYNPKDGFFIDAASSNITIGSSGGILGSMGGNTISGNSGAGVRSSGTNIWVFNNTISGNGVGVAVEAGDTHLAVTTFDSLAVSGGTASTDYPATFGSASVTGGTVSLLPGGTLTISGAYIQSGGQTLVGGSTLVVGGLLDEQGGLITLAAGTIQPGGFTVEYGALLSGTGTIAGNLTNAGEISIGPGVVPALHVTGNYAQTAAGILNINLDDTCMPQLNVDGGAALDGTLDVNYLGSTPVSGLEYDLVTYGGHSGTFAVLIVSGPFTPYYDTHRLYLLAH